MHNLVYCTITYSLACKAHMEMMADAAHASLHGNGNGSTTAAGGMQQHQQQQRSEDAQSLLLPSPSPSPSPSPLPPPSLLASAMPIDRAASASTQRSSSSASLQSVKKRRTKNFKLREDMERARGSIDVRIPALDPPTFANWDDFIRAWTAYMQATKTLYRRRSSCTTAAWNTRYRIKKFAVPNSFQYATMAYWCTHGCIQPSRGTGVRAHLHNRFTGCMARITADVVYETRGSDDDVRWFIRVRNQVDSQPVCHYRHHRSTD